MDTRKENREIFETMPDAFWAGDIPSTHKKWQAPAVVAAVLVPLLAAGLVLFTRPQVVQNTVAEVSYHVDNGVKGSILLADGTTVNLNSGSSLKVLDRRRVFLDGEGWFEVESDQEHPFYVDTPSGVSVKVTGTQFNLSNYKDEDFKVLLVKGSIELKSAPKGTPLVVKPSEQVTIRRGMASKEFANMQEKQNATAWREGVLVFDDKPLREAIPMLERWYGVNISVNSPALYEERLTGEFDTETIQEVLNVLALIHGFTYTLDHKDITIALI
jgi:ferric-dicitrate binding protein FerR (iron transport regulator)